MINALNSMLIIKGKPSTVLILYHHFVLRLNVNASDGVRMTFNDTIIKSKAFYFQVRAFR